MSLFLWLVALDLVVIKNNPTVEDGTSLISEQLRETSFPRQIMINPAGQECRFYYQDYHRGHSEELCRLIRNNALSAPWEPKDCFHCPVPEILRANSNPDLVLEATIKKGILGINRQVKVKAFCSRHLIDVEKPEVGCPQCALDRPGLKGLFDKSL